MPPRHLLDVSIDLQVEEAELIAVSGVRLAVKNLLILRTLRDGKAFDQGWYIAAVRQELLNLADETERDAGRVLEERERALKREGRAMFQDDYRLIDADLLDRREKVLRGLVERLRSLGTDEEFVATVIAEARESALDEVAAAIHVPPLTGGQADAEQGWRRQQGLAGLRADLAALSRQAQRRPKDPVG